MNSNFFSHIRNKIAELFVPKMDSELVDIESNDDKSSTDEFRDCEEYYGQEVVNDCYESTHLCQSVDSLALNQRNDGFGQSLVSMPSKQSTDQMNKDLKNKPNPRAMTDWYDLVTQSDSQSNCSSSNRSMDTKRPNEWKVSLNSMKESNRLLEKWGESVGIYDSSGAHKRLVALSELRNYFELKLSSLNRSDCLLLCALINGRYPRFYTSTVNYYQRWRMRYNIFVASDTLMSGGDRRPEPTQAAITVSELCAEQLVLHIGEIHLYFDIVPQYCQPVYVNSSFYPNKCSINTVPNVVFDKTVMNRINRIVNSIRYSKDIFQFKFPINADLFHRKTELFDKFAERQIEFIEESIKVFRKNEQKKQKFYNWSQREMKFKERQETRDESELEYDSGRDVWHQNCENRNNYMSYRSNRGFGRNYRSENQTIRTKSKAIEAPNDETIEFREG